MYSRHVIFMGCHLNSNSLVTEVLADCVWVQLFAGALALIIHGLGKVCLCIPLATSPPFPSLFITIPFSMGKMTLLYYIIEINHLEKVFNFSYLNEAFLCASIP